MNVKILNVAHDTTSTRREWMRELVDLYSDAFPHFERRFGFAYRTNADGAFELTSDGFYSPDHLSSENVLGILSGFNSASDTSSVQNLFNQVTCASLSQRLGELEAGHLLEIPQAFDIKDVVAVSSGNYGGSGFVFASFQEKVSRLSRPERRQWMYVAAHVAAIARIRLTKDSCDYLSLAEWIYDKKTGRVVEAKEHAASKAVSQRLIETTKAIDRFRVSRDASVVRRWAALTEGRWTLLDVVDGPQRFVIAMPNDPPVRKIVAMTAIQSRVLWFLLQGHSQTFIAYELGLSEAAVSRELGRIRKRFVVNSTVELLRLTRGMLSEHPLPPDLSETHTILLDCISRGLSDSEIAAYRKRSVKTIRNQLRSIYRDLGVNSRTELVAKYTF